MYTEVVGWTTTDTVENSTRPKNILLRVRETVSAGKDIGKKRGDDGKALDSRGHDGCASLP